MIYNFIFVEEYIEFIAGLRDIDGRAHSFLSFSSHHKDINLARYDADVVNSLAQQTLYKKTPYTDKQAALAVKLISNYRRQLTKLGIQVPDVLDQFKFGIRLYDRSKSMLLEDKHIVVKFPYDENLVNMFRVQNKEGTGSVRFDHIKKIWVVTLTENMVNWAVTLGKHHNFDISSDLLDLYTSVLESEVIGHKIELQQIGSKYSITNADSNLIDYIEENLGGFDLSNLLILADNAETLGYTLPEEITNKITHQYPDKLGDFILKRKTSLKHDGSYLEEVLIYARQVNRLPIHVYDPMANKQLDTDEVKYLKQSFGPPALSPKLLVTTTPIIMGNKKQSWFTRAEKIIHITR